MLEGKLLDHPMLEAGKLSRMKILRVKADQYLPITAINHVLRAAIQAGTH